MINRCRPTAEGDSRRELANALALGTVTLGTVTLVVGCAEANEDVGAVAEPSTQPERRPFAAPEPSRNDATPRIATARRAVVMMAFTRRRAPCYKDEDGLTPRRTTP